MTTFPATALREYDIPGRSWDEALGLDVASLPEGRIMGLVAQMDILCHRCNTVLGLMDDDPERLRTAANYLDAVMDAQADLIEVVHELRQVVCVKG